MGAYEIVALLGAGGMGEVYRARDSKLQRDVAIKILPAAFGQDPERVLRFRREAQILASLNHPNIGVIFDLQEDAGIRYLVLELVEGETLADRLKRGPLPVDEALDVCKQVAEALEAAHEKEVLHRDLKPANIRITPEGRVKVLDFGLAKVMERAEAAPQGGIHSESPTLMSAAMTAGGVILGTPAYMSPEQARGRDVERGTDVWAFGCVLFETLTADRAFQGEDLTEVLASVVKGQPDWKSSPPDVPAVVRSLLRQCLQKQLKRRLRDAGAARIALEDAIAEPASELRRLSVSNRMPWTRVIPLVGAAVLVAVIGVLVFRPPPSTDLSVTRALMEVAPAERFHGGGGGLGRPSRIALAVSPDGRTVVFNGIQSNVNRLFKRRADESEAAPMPGTEGARGPFFSPDGRWVGFWSGGKLKKAPLDGGPPVEICSLPADAAGLFGASWGDDDAIVFSARGEGISKVSSGGGTPVVLTKGDPATSDGRHTLPHLLPGGKAMLYTASAALTDWEQTNIVALSFEGGQRKTLIRGGTDARYLSSGHLLYMKPAL